MADQLSTYDPDKFMPNIVDVMEIFEASGDEAGALEWLSDEGIGPLPITVKMMHVMGTNDFEIPGFETRNGTPVFRFSPGETNCLAFPIMRDGYPHDLLVMGLTEMDYHTVCGDALWLGEDNLYDDVVRLHFSPLEWLDAGCTGVCQIHPYARRHLASLRNAKTIQCNSIELAMEAWDWVFDADDRALDRIDCDDHPENIKAYFDRRVVGAADHKLASL